MFLTALSVTPWFCVSSLGGFGPNVTDHWGGRAHHHVENEVTDSISFCLAYSLMSSYISSPFFNGSFFFFLFTFLIPFLQRQRNRIFRCERGGDYKRKGNFGSWRVSLFVPAKNCVHFLLPCNKLLQT